MEYALNQGTMYTPEQRAEALYYYFGWQGGTIHQLAKETGLDATQILYGEWPTKEGYTHKDNKPALLLRDLGGFSAVRTCDRDWRVNTLASKHQGDLVYWAAVIHGYWVTGPLKTNA